MNVVGISGCRRQSRRGEPTATILELQPDLVVVGDAAGVDFEVLHCCRTNGIALVQAIATGEWPAAGPRRNGIMVRVLRGLRALGDNVTWRGFPDWTSRGTHNFAKQASDAGLTGNVIPWVGR